MFNLTLRSLIFLFVGFFSLQQLAAYRADYSQTSLLRHANKVYYIEPILKLNWHGALHYCKYHGMELASVTSLSAHEALTNFIINKNIRQFYWIAGNDLEFNDIKEFYWANTGEKMEFSKFSANNPDNHQQKENCVHMFYENNGEWNDNQCSVNAAFICELRL